MVSTADHETIQPLRPSASNATVVWFPCCDQVIVTRLISAHAIFKTYTRVFEHWLQMSTNRVGKLEPSKCALLVCDVQERFTPLITGFDVVMDTCCRMVSAACLYFCRTTRDATRHHVSNGHTIQAYLRGALTALRLPVPAPWTYLFL